MLSHCEVVRLCGGACSFAELTGLACAYFGWRVRIAWGESAGAGAPEVGV
eukprot:COSAG01_NODE_40780_length_459_cov_5.872222_1_plen_49_part_01